MKRRETIPETTRPPPPAEWAQLTDRISPIKNLPHAIQEALRNEVAIRSLERREILFYENEVSTAVHLLLRGVAALTYLDQRERSVLLAILSPGDIVGDTPFLPDSLRGRLRCEAFRPCVVGTIDYRRLVEIVFGTTFPQFAAGMSLLFGTWSERLTHAPLSHGIPLRDRLIAVLTSLAQRVGVPDRRGTILDLPITHAELADLVGASRPKVTHQLAILQQEGLITRQSRRIILSENLSPFNTNKDSRKNLNNFGSFRYKSS